MDKNLESIFSCFDSEFYIAIKNIKADINEIRIRSDKPVVVYIYNKPFVMLKSGDTIPLNIFNASNEYISVTFTTLKKAFGRLCEYSIYKHQNDINNGFITVKGGHRIGICGTAVNNSGNIKSVIDITSINIRVARQYIGCSETFLNCVNIEKGVLICGVPSTGKTTLLRDLSRSLSEKYCKKISVIDERSEISSIFNGERIFDMGLCDVYCGFSKDKGVIQAIRTMSPEFIICDELTGDDIESVIFTVNYGVKLIATVHCDSLNNALKNPSILSLLQTRAFGEIVFLKSRTFCEIDKIYNLSPSGDGQYEEKLLFADKIYKPDR